MERNRVAALNRRLTALAELHGLTAVARVTSSDRKRLELKAVDSVNGQPVIYTEEMPLSELNRLGPTAVARQFIETAQTALQSPAVRLR
jgi:hypothetical protein